MRILFIIPAISEYYPDIAANDNKNIFTSTPLSHIYLNVGVGRVGLGWGGLAWGGAGWHRHFL